jgi:hypothetical protein
MVTELKRTTKRLRGDVNGPWEESTDDSQWTPMLSSGREINPYQQVTAAANAMKEWLWVHQRFFLDDEEVRPEDAFKVWPDLLIIGPEGIAPILPLRPPSRFGLWFHQVERWLTHVRGWRSLPGGVTLAEANARRLAEQLHLVQVWPDKSAALTGERAGGGTPDEQSVLARLADLEARVARLESGLPERRVSHAAQSRSQPSPNVEPLSEEEKAALVGAVTTAKLAGKSRALPNIISYMDRLLGHQLKAVAYNGRGTATALVEQARVEGVVQFGPKSGPNVTIYLPGEEIPPG